MRKASGFGQGTHLIYLEQERIGSGRINRFANWVEIRA
jgi:hypothetical protein